MAIDFQYIDEILCFMDLLLNERAKERENIENNYQYVSKRFMRMHDKKMPNFSSTFGQKIHIL